ncbi:hypothetical protein E9229_000360 [Paeniglutamicibacter cryotolerans]|uniref:Lipoprotein n=2 Tax=Paeniglutamicibacter cryotolerans TaxID=670079 RepID=A0A839QDE8_9MICC|nr:hypothetical protein [Paeniglutamicibacter cryotolerans]
MFRMRGTYATALALVLALTGCTNLVDSDPQLPADASKTAAPAVGNSDVLLFYPRVDPGPKNTDTRSPAELVRAGEHPLQDAKPGTEKVLVSKKFTGSGHFGFARPGPDTYLWILISCSRSTPTDIQTFDEQGSITARYAYPSCSSVPSGGATLDSSGVRGTISVDSGVDVTLSVISARRTRH